MLFMVVECFICNLYGVANICKFPPVEIYEDVTPFSLLGGGGMFELVFGAMLMMGLLTRLAAFILSGEMAFAYFIEHFPHSFFPLLNEGALAIMFCFSCLYLASAGGGPLSLDALLRIEPRLQPDVSRT